MYRDRILRPLLLTLVWGVLGPAVHAGEVVLIGHSAVPRLDRVTVERIFTGKVVEVGGIRVTPIDLPVGDAVRNRFLARWLGKDEERYTAYWTVRRYVGKGVPPQEAASAAEVIRQVAAMPGGIGYIDEAELKAGMNVVAR
jgi:hypothetical protein